MPIEDWTGSEVIGRRPGAKYVILARLAEGGMANVYRARSVDGSDVVVKTPLPNLLASQQFVGRFNREIRTLMGFNHPHIVRLLDSGEVAGVPFLVVPYYSGGTLATRQERAGSVARPMPLDTVPGWLNPVASAVDYLHQRNLIHRDLKPENIFFDAKGQPLVADFGIVKAVADDPELEATVYTQPGSTLGTPVYMAPELIMGRSVDGRIDVYALGVMVYEWLTAKIPFDGTNPAAILVKQFNASKSLVHPCELNPAIPVDIATLVLKAMAINPAERYRRASEFAAALTETIRATTVTITSPSPPPQAEPDSSFSAAPSRPPVVAPLIAAPAATAGSIVGQFMQSLAELNIPREPISRGLMLAHLLLAWIVLLGGLTRLGHSSDEITVGGAVLLVANVTNGGLPPGEISLVDATAAVVLWPLVFLVAAALEWFRRPAAVVTGLLLGAAVTWGGMTGLIAGITLTRPVILGGWLAPWWIGVPYAIGIWVVSLRTRERFLAEPWPPAVTVLARVSVLLGGGLLVASVTTIAHFGGTLTVLQWLLLLATSAAGAVLIPSGMGLLRGKEWARVTILAVGGLLALSVLGLLYFAAALIVLLRHTNTTEFRPENRDTSSR